MCAAVKRAAERAACLGSSALYLTNDDDEGMKVCSASGGSYYVPLLKHCHFLGNADRSSGEWALLECVSWCHIATQLIDIYLVSCE